MKLARRRFLCLAAGAAALPACSNLTWAQTYPVRPVRIMVPFPAGGTTDIAARLVGQWLSERLSQPFIIENKPGAGGNIGTETVIRAPSDGYTLLQIGAYNVINSLFYETLTFNFMRDIAPIAPVMRVPLVIVVHPSLPAMNLPELVAYAKANASKVSMAVAGNGTTLHVSGELFKMMTGINMINVPYRGAAPALTDLISGQVQIMFDFVSSSLEHIRTGKVRALAVTETTRSELLPDVPTVAEFVPGYEASGWFGVGAPRNTSPNVIEMLNREVNAALIDPKLKSRLGDLGAIVFAASVADFKKHIADEAEKWGKVIKFAGIRPT